jgi:hypothetical protein
MAEATEKPTKPPADPQAEALARKKAKQAYRKELRELQLLGTVVVRLGTKPRLVQYLNRDEKKDLIKMGREIPKGPTPEQSKRMHELHYLIEGKPVPIREDLDD